MKRKFFKMFFPILTLVLIGSFFVMSSNAQKRDVKKSVLKSDLKGSNTLSQIKSNINKPGALKAMNKKRSKSEKPVIQSSSASDLSRILPDKSEILLNAGSLNTDLPELQAQRTPVGAFSGNRLHLVQLSGPTRGDWYNAISKTGVRIVTYIPFYSYLVYGSSNSVASLQTLAARSNFIQWDGPFLDAYKIHPNALSVDEKGNARKLPTDMFAIQLVEDDAANTATLAVIDKLKLTDVVAHSKELGYVNIKVRLNPDSVFEIAKQAEVVSIQLSPIPIKNDERQDMIVDGILSGNDPGPAGHLAFLASSGFTQPQFTASGFGVDISDSGIDDATTSPNHFGLYELGNIAGTSRVAYNRLVGTPNGGSTLQGCDGHGTINAHIVAGFNDLNAGFPHEDASGYNFGLGVCPFVKVGSSVIFDPNSFTFPDYEDLQSMAYNDGMRLSTNSWGAAVGGAYNTDAQRYDALVRDAQPTGSTFPVVGNQEMVILFTSGNSGPGANTVGSPGTGKNVITVGAAENVQAFGGPDGCGIGDTGADSANDMISFSSRGPCDDGRTKPEIVAPGTHVSGGVFQISGPPANGQADACFTAGGVCGGPGPGFDFWPLGQEWYTASSGTSHSCPAVAGGAALLRQDFINGGPLTEGGSNPPSPAMTKAYLTNSARYLNGAGANDTLPSQSQGMGEMDLGFAFDGTARIVRDQIPADTFTDSAQTRGFTGTVSDNTKPFRVSLAWTDTPGPTSGNAFVNDLNLTVMIGGNTYLGNVFSGANSTTGGSADLNDNLESVFLPAGITGPFSITVNAANIAGDGVPGDADLTDQDFALLCYNCIATTLPVISTAGSNITAENCLPPNNQVDPGETVTIDFSLQNVGTLDTVNLVATLQATGGVTSPSGPQNYGALTAGGPSVTRPFTFTASASCGDVITATFDLQDGATNLGTVAFTFNTGTFSLPTTFSNPAAITINDNAVASPYPSLINVAGFVGTVAKVTVQLNDLSHTFPDDIDVLLVGPTGQTLMVMSDAGSSGLVVNIDLTFDDDAASAIPDSATLTTGTFRPADYTPADTMPVPAPAPPYGATLSVFNGLDPNGTWSLYVRDDANVDIGSIASGWTLNLHTFDCCTNICPTITINPLTLPNGQNGVPYDQTVSASGGTPPYTFSVSSGTLPTGLTLNPATGQISGTPTVESTFNFDITATDNNGCTGTRSYSITIGPLCANPPTITTTTLSNGAETVPYSQTVQAAGGTPPYTWSVSAGALPPGLTLNTGTGEISGTPSAGSAGLYNFTVMVIDTVVGCSDTQDLSITIDVAPPCNYQDLFDNDVLTWVVEKPTVTETGGNLVLNPAAKRAIATSDPVFAGCQNCTITAEIQFTAGDFGSKSWLLTHRVDKKNQIEVLLKASQGVVVIKQKVGVVVKKAKGNFAFAPNTVYTVAVNYDGTDYELTIDGTPVATLVPVGTIPSGILGFQSKLQTTMVNSVCQTP